MQQLGKVGVVAINEPRKTRKTRNKDQLYEAENDTIRAAVLEVYKTKDCGFVLYVDSDQELSHFCGLAGVADG